jgi:GT2 family glycosyltransferase
MICAVLIPSRARPTRLHRTLTSIFETVSNKDNIEILLRFDDDDQETLSELDKFKSYPNTKITIGPRKNGWNSVNEFYSEMANETTAPWISIMNDDAVFEGKDWDVSLNTFPRRGIIVQPELYQLGMSKYFNIEGGAFPFVPNGCWKQFGYEIIPDPVDTQLDCILRIDNGWKTEFLVGFGIIHDRDDEETLNLHRS